MPSCRGSLNGLGKGVGTNRHPAAYDVDMIGVFLTTFNFLEKTRACLESFARTADVPYRLVVVDNASSDGTPDYMRKSGLEVLINPKPVDLTKALNQGIRHLLADRTVDAIIWIHNDMLFFKGWLSRLVAVVENRPDIGKLAPWNVSGNPAQYSDEWAQRFMDNHWQEFIPGNNCPWVMRREIIEAVGLFDERFLKCGGFEDWDYNNRVAGMGYLVGTTGASVVWHEGMGTRRHVNNSEACLHNSGLYASKWGGDKTW